MDADTCRVDKCDRPVKVKKEALCGLHYVRLRRHGDPEAWKKPRRPECAVGGCTLRAVGHGLCDTHYRRQRRYGTTDAPFRPTVCAVENCDQPVASHALCDRHYRRARKGSNERACRHCGNRIDPTAHGRRKFCSEQCRKRDQYLQRQKSYRATWLKRYGMTVEDFEVLIAEQRGRCAICRTDRVPTRGNWNVDHCHKSGKVRGLLCQKCNTGLGKFRDDSDLLRRAATYIEEASSRT